MSSSSSQRGPSGSAHPGGLGHPATPSARSHRTFASVDRGFASETGGTEHDAYGEGNVDMGMDMVDDGGEAVHFCLLAEFDIDAGATLSDQYPHPTGTDEQSVSPFTRLK